MSVGKWNVVDSLGKLGEDAVEGFNQEGPGKEVSPARKDKYQNNNTRIIIPKDMDMTEWLIDWYRSECNGDWEHAYGIQIDTIDNPGWSLKIDLLETSLEGKKCL